ncbi:MAG: Gfo/Idh/MocA family oxidoreductase [Candidatus Latescibacterota bacterium]|nr:Gfo/Idh/MocA family oxidoreductase [Candidatus Latescibacterota bacterium]
MADPILRVAVIGGAGMWGRGYLRAAVAHSECDVILVDSALKRRDAFAEHYGIAHVADSWQQLLERETPDIACCILPVALAPEAVIACAEAGVRVVSCEKPIAIELGEADRMVEACRSRRIPFGCGTAYWEVPRLAELSRWLTDGHLGALTAVAIPGGLPVEVSGAGCVQFTHLRGLTGLEVEWVEGSELPPVDSYRAPEASDVEVDCPAYGRIGLVGGVICEVLKPRAENHIPCRVSATYENGQVFLQRPEPIIIEGTGAEASPVRPDFVEQLCPSGREPVFQRLVDAVRNSDTEVACSGHDYRQALEIAIAFKRSASRGGQRVPLPLDSRNYRIYPHPYRMRGGDVAGWESIGYDGPPPVEGRPQREAKS